MKAQKINGKYIISGIIAVVFTWFIHEFTHWFTSELLGYETKMYLNGTSPAKNENPTKFHSAIISISGPLITLLQAFVVWIILKATSWNKYLYTFLFTAFYMRVLAGFMNFIHVNDEGRVSQYLGMGTFTLSIIVNALLFFMVYTVSKKYALHWKFQLGTYLIILVASSILILTNQFFPIRLI